MGAVPLALGPFSFHATRFGFYGLGRELSTRWADIDIAGGLNQLQWTGGEGDAVLIAGVLFPEEFGGLGTMEALRGAAESGAVLPLVSLGGNVYGMHVIEGVSEEQSHHDAWGLPRKDEYRIRLRRYPAGQAFSPISILTTLFG